MFFAVNLALNKPSSQISTYYAGVASYANDGAQTSSCSYSAANAWWAVDLEAMYEINSVTVTNDHNSYFCNYTHTQLFLYLQTARLTEILGKLNI